MQLIAILQLPFNILSVSLEGLTIVQLRLLLSTIASINRISEYGSLSVFCNTYFERNRMKNPIYLLVSRAIAEMHISLFTSLLFISEIMFLIPSE